MLMNLFCQFGFVSNGFSCLFFAIFLVKRLKAARGSSKYHVNTCKNQQQYFPKHISNRKITTIHVGVWNIECLQFILLHSYKRTNKRHTFSDILKFQIVRVYNINIACKFEHSLFKVINKLPELASCTALLIALLDTVLLRWKISANSASLIIGGGGSCLIGLWRLSSRSLGKILFTR